MRYLVTSNNSEPFLTKWFDIEDHWIDGVEMVVYNLISGRYTNDGVKWLEIKFDNL